MLGMKVCILIQYSFKKEKCFYEEFITLSNKKLTSKSDYELWKCPVIDNPQLKYQKIPLQGKFESRKLSKF